jgi:hypothetical protein
MKGVTGTANRLTIAVARALVPPVTIELASSAGKLLSRGQDEALVHPSAITSSCRPTSDEFAMSSIDA